MILNTSYEIELRPRPPFHFDGTVHKPSHFPYTEEIKASFWEPDSFWFTIRKEDELFGLKLENAGTVDAPLLKLTVFSDHTLAPDKIAVISEEVTYHLDLNLNLAPFNVKVERDELMQPVLKRWRGMRIMGGSLYKNLMIYVVLQNAPVRRSMQMIGNLLRYYGTPMDFNDQTIYAFWPPQVLDAVPEKQLRALKVGYRAKSLKRISNQFARGKFDEMALHGLSNQELKRELLKLYGIGPASTWYLMFEVFHRYDVFECIPPWEQKIYSRLLFEEELVPAEQILAEVEARWGRWKMLAAHYLFEDLFWRHKHEPLPWLEELVRRKGEISPKSDRV